MVLFPFFTQILSLFLFWISLSRFTVLIFSFLRPVSRSFLPSREPFHLQDILFSLHIFFTRLLSVLFPFIPLSNIVFVFLPYRDPFCFCFSFILLFHVLSPHLFIKYCHIFSIYFSVVISSLFLPSSSLHFQHTSFSHTFSF